MNIWWGDPGYGYDAYDACLFGETPENGSDLMGSIKRTGHDKWCIAYWKRPHDPGSRQELNFEGTLGEAKAYVAALVQIQER